MIHLITQEEVTAVATLADERGEMLFNVDISNGLLGVSVNMYLDDPDKTYNMIKGIDASNTSSPVQP